MLSLWQNSRHSTLGLTKFYFSTSTCVKKEVVGFIGLGNMGAHMAKNLLKKGYPVVANDVSPTTLQNLVEAGASKASSPADVVSQAKAVVTMLPASAHVQEVYKGNDGIFSKIKPGTLLIDSSTIDPSVARDVAAEAVKKGALFVDAPVSGGVNAARDGILTFMVGGETEAFERAKDILSSMGKNVVHCGSAGNGQAAKVCNNMLLGISMIGTAETMNLGVKLGLDPKLLAKILNMSSGRCWSSEVYNPCPGVVEGIPASNDYKGGFGSVLMAKDLGLAQNAALSTFSPTPMGSLALQIYRLMCNAGYSTKDFASVYQFLQAVSKKP